MPTIVSVGQISVIQQQDFFAMLCSMHAERTKVLHVQIWTDLLQMPTIARVVRVETAALPLDCSV